MLRPRPYIRTLQRSPNCWGLNDWENRNFHQTHLSGYATTARYGIFQCQLWHLDQGRGGMRRGLCDFAPKPQLLGYATAYNSSGQSEKSNFLFYILPHWLSFLIKPRDGNSFPWTWTRVLILQDTDSSPIHIIWTRTWLETCGLGLRTTAQLKIPFISLLTSNVKKLRSDMVIGLPLTRYRNVMSCQNIKTFLHDYR